MGAGSPPPIFVLGCQDREPSPVLDLAIDWERITDAPLQCQTKETIGGVFTMDD